MFPTNKPELKINLAGEKLDLEFVIGCIRVKGEDEETGRSLICGEMDENDMLNSLRFITRDVVRLLHQWVPTDELLEAVNQCVTDGMNEGLVEVAVDPEAFN